MGNYLSKTTHFACRECGGDGALCRFHNNGSEKKYHGNKNVGIKSGWKLMRGWRGEKESENDLRIVFPLDFTSMLNNNEKKKIHCKGFPTLINANLLRCGMKNSNTSALASDIRVNMYIASYDVFGAYFVNVNIFFSVHAEIACECANDVSGFRYFNAQSSSKAY